MELVHASEPRHALRGTLCFALLLYVSWVGAWVLEQELEHRSVWMTTSGGRFAYWTAMKLLLWVLPAVILLRRAGPRLCEVMGLRRVRSIVLWGGGIGLVFAASALITRAIGHRPLFASRVGWPFVGGVIVAPIVEEIAFRGAILQGLLTRYRFMAANTLTAILFMGIHLPGWHFQGRLWDMLADPVGGALSILIIGWIFGLVAYRGRSVAASTLTHVLNNLFSAS